MSQYVKDEMDDAPIIVKDEMDEYESVSLLVKEDSPPQPPSAVIADIESATEQLWRVHSRMRREGGKGGAAPARPPRRPTQSAQSVKTLEQLESDTHVVKDGAAIKPSTSADMLAAHMAQRSGELTAQPSNRVIVQVPFECRDFRQYVEQTLAPIEAANTDAIAGRGPLGSVSLAFIPRSQQSTRAASSSSSSSSAAAKKDELPKPAPPVLPYHVHTAPIESVFAYTRSIKTFEAQTGMPKRGWQLPSQPHPCPRRHVERMLVSPFNGAPACMHEQRCVALVCYQIKLRKYVSPEEYESGKRASTSDPGACYLCYLALLFHQYIDESNKRPGGMLKILQPFYHIVDKPGEYRSEALIPPISSKVDDTSLEDLRCTTPTTSAENTYGLVAPLVAFCQHYYTVGLKDVHINGAWEKVACLNESTELLFTEHAQAFEPLHQINPFQYTVSKELYTPTTVFIMCWLFSPDNTEHVIGAERMRNYGTYASTAERARCLPFRWCFQTKSHEQARFPWQYIFDTDLRVTVAHLDELLERGCIDLDLVMLRRRSADLNVVVDQQPQGSYAAKLRTELYMNRWYYVAYRLRVAVLQTLRRVYPKSKNSNRDITVVTRTDILLRWNIKHFHPIIKRTTADETVSADEIARIARIEPDNHYFPEDDVHRKFTREIVARQTPREYLREWLGEMDELLPFDQLRLKLGQQFLVRRSYGSPPKNSSYFEYPEAATMYATRGHSIFAAVHMRVNWAAALHNTSERQLFAVEQEVEAADADYVAERCSFARLQRLEAKRRQLREQRYNLRLFVLTHLDIIARAEQYKDWSDAFFLSRVEHPTNPNYAMRHYDEVEPYDIRVYHEGMLPDIAKYMCCVPFPDQKDAGVRENNTSTNHLFRMIGLLLPRNNASRTNNKQHIKLCTEHAAYRKLAANVAMVSFTGAYRHADYLPPLEHCLRVREVMVAPQAEHFMNWQRCFKSLAVLAMREYVVFLIKLCTPYHYYLLYQYPYWQQYVRQTNALANVIRLAACRGHGLAGIQYDVQRIIKPKAQEGFHFNHDISNIINRLVGRDKTIDWSQCRHEMQIDELRTLCRHLSVINTNRARAQVARVPMPHILNEAIIAKAYSIPRQSPIDLEWLLEFNFGVTEPPEQVNVSSLTIKLLEYAFYFILLGPSKTNSVSLALTAIPFKDYEIVDAFFFNLFTHYSITVIDIDNPELARRQYEAVLRRNDMTEKDMPVSPWTHSLMMAPCCGTIRSYITQQDGALLYGGNTVCIDPFTNEVVCGVNTDYDIRKKSYRVVTLLERRLNQLLMAGQVTQALYRVLKRIMKLVPQEMHNRFFQQPKCGSIPLVGISLIGRIAQVTAPKVARTNVLSPTTNAFTICEHCGGIMLFSTKFYGANGLCCNACCIAHNLEAHTPMCVAKRHRIKIDTPIHVFKVIDDRPGVGTYRITRMYVCHRCYTRKTAGYAQHQQYILTASGLARAKHFYETSMNYSVATCSGEPLADYFDPRLSNYVQRSRARLDRLLSGQPE